MTTAQGTEESVAGQLGSARRAWLPTGRPLDHDTWRLRHRSVVALLWAHVVGLTGFGLVRGVEVLHLSVEVAAIAATAIVAGSVTSRRLGATVATIGLVSCSALIVHLSGGLIEAHFHFFIMVGVVTLYQDWLPFGAAMSFVVVHHGVMGTLDPESVYNHPAAVNRPLLWAVIHGVFITGAALAGLRSWKHAEIERERAEDAGARLKERMIRQREALRINDTVVQGLVAARYAAELGERQLVDSAVERTLRLAQQLVADLMEGDEVVFAPGGLRHVAAGDAPLTTPG